jgi:hypothetical protein
VPGGDAGFHVDYWDYWAYVEALSLDMLFMLQVVMQGRECIGTEHASTHRSSATSLLEIGLA